MKILARFEMPDGTVELVEMVDNKFTAPCGAVRLLGLVAESSTIPTIIDTHLGSDLLGPLAGNY